MHRRTFLAQAAVTAAFAGYAARANSQAAKPETYRNEVPGYGPLKPDPYGIFDLPEGFTYQVISQAGQTMDDGLLVPYKADGMACMPLGGLFGLVGDDRVVLVRNHELRPTDRNHGPLGLGRHLSGKIDMSKVYDVDEEGFPLPGGTTTLVYDTRRRRLVRQHLSLAGTVFNCAGGGTPWGSWLTCEESVLKPGQGGVKKDHGWVFEVPGDARGLVEPVPLKALGRFQHEAAAVDPRTGVIYLTEDSFDSKGLFYRFLPNDRTKPLEGGRLQALGVRGAPGGGDVRNFKGEPVTWKPGDVQDVTWIDLDGVDNPDGDLRMRGQAKGAAFVGRGEGIFFGNDAIYFACTSSGPARLGQILRYVPSPKEGQPGEADEPGKLHLFVEPSDPLLLNWADNIAISPWGHIFACEDNYSDTDRNHLRGLTPEGKSYIVGRNVFEGNAELAGVCFSPDGTTLFVNVYWPGITLAITGPWGSFRAA